MTYAKPEARVLGDAVHVIYGDKAGPTEPNPNRPGPSTFEIED
jgi:hypothetical protein